MTKAIVLLSGGLDSATVMARAIEDGHDVIALSFNYGQRNSRELLSARTIATAAEIKQHFIVDVNLADWGGSPLTRGPETLQEHYEPPHRTALSNYVPGRNTVFIALALSLAEAKGAELIYLGFTAADKHYPDTQQTYLDEFAKLASLSTKIGQSGATPRLVAPFIDDNKVSIVLQALRLQVPVAETWSCYLDGEEPCGSCGACRIRDRAFILAGRPDLATFKGRDFHKEEAASMISLFWRFMLRGSTSKGAKAGQQQG